MTKQKHIEPQLPAQVDSSVLSKQTIEDLEKAFDGDLDLVLFFLSWVKNGRNATKAYKELNPHVDPASAQVLGSRQLAKIDRGAVMQSYGLGIQEYFQQMREGHEAMKWNDFTGEREPDHKVRESYNKRIGELLGVESKSGNTTNVQVVIPILGETKPYVPTDDSNQ